MTIRTAMCRRAGFSLFEMLAVLVALAACMLFGTTLIITTMKVNAAGDAAANRVSYRRELARQFREDIAQANAAPDKVDGLAAGPTQLILQMPNKAMVLYRWDNNVLERIERLGEKESRRSSPVGPAGSRVEFVQTKDGLITMRVAEPSAREEKRLTEISAALGGDLR